MMRTFEPSAAFHLRRRAFYLENAADFGETAALHMRGLWFDPEFAYRNARLAFHFALLTLSTEDYRNV